LSNLLRVTIFYLLFCLLFFSCSKKGVKGYDIFFVDSQGNATSTANFEVRPYIVWQVVCSDVLSDDIDRLSGFTQAETHYNWFSIAPVIKNNSDYDLVLDKITMTTSFLGSSSGDNVKTTSAENGCMLAGSNSCQFCFPRTISPGAQVNMAVNPSGNCLFHSGDDKTYKAARVILTVEVVSEVNGRITKTMDLFATPKEDFDPSFAYGTLLSSDGEGTCRGEWAWDIWEDSGATNATRDPAYSSTECCSLDN
jgi:hypothetical protein